jgi:branched-chain amino acid transport system ATP-binding protein
MLKIRDLNVHYGGIHALKGVSLDVPDGAIVTLIGANGAGKTTTLRAITGLAKPTSGSIEFEGRSIQATPPHEIVRLGVSMAAEGRRIFRNLTVRENLMMGAYHRDDMQEIRNDMEWVTTLFPRLKERFGQKGGTLSGGEQQMLAVGRALMSRPKLLCLDEPSLGLAPMLVQEVFRALSQIHEEGSTILLVEQNAKAALKIADYGYVLRGGTVTMHGDGRELLADESVRRAYLGE